MRQSKYEGKRVLRITLRYRVRLALASSHLIVPNNYTVRSNCPLFSSFLPFCVNLRSLSHFWCMFVRVAIPANCRKRMLFNHTQYTHVHTDWHWQTATFFLFGAPTFPWRQIGLATFSSPFGLGGCDYQLFALLAHTHTLTCESCFSRNFPHFFFLLFQFLPATLSEWDFLGYFYSLARGV